MSRAEDCTSRGGWALVIVAWVSSLDSRRTVSLLSRLEIRVPTRGRCGVKEVVVGGVVL